jgi:hypothetical protein
VSEQEVLSAEAYLLFYSKRKCTQSRSPSKNKDREEETSKAKKSTNKFKQDPVVVKTEVKVEPESTN